MSLVVVGSVALDSVETPSQKRDNLLGGSGAYFSYAASFFTPVRLLSVVGDDWPPEHTELLNSRDIDTSGLQVVAGRFPNDGGMPEFAVTPTLTESNPPRVAGLVLSEGGAPAGHYDFKIFAPQARAVIQRLVREGRVFQADSESNDVLKGYACAFRTVDKTHYHEYLGYARWFYGGDDFPVLQLVWPDKNGRFPWDADFADSLRWSQPVLEKPG